MKSTESLDDAGKSVDLASATGETTLPSETSSPENKRRRLVRGAVAFAPLVLTLRSGALAAASCTGAKVLAVTTSDTGLFTPPAGSGVIEGDYCVVSAQACGPEHPTKISVGTVDSSAITGPNGGGQFQCGTTGPRTVAILSSGSATSLRG